MPRQPVSTEPAQPNGKLAPVNRAAKAVVRWTSSAVDRIARPRNRRNDRLGNSFSTHLPEIYGTDFAETAMKPLLGRIRQTDPHMAERLEWEYTEKLMGAERKVRELIAEAQSLLDVKREAAEAANAEIDRCAGEARARRDAEIEAEQQAIRALEPRLMETQAGAAELAGRCGGRFDPAEPSVKDVLAVPVPTDEAAAAGLSVPDPTNDRAVLPPSRAVTVLEAIIGAVFGFSYMMVSHFNEPETLLRKWPVTLAFMVIGAAVVLVIGAALRIAGHNIGASAYSGAPRRVWMWVLGIALFLSVAFVALQAAVDVNGILRVANSTASMDQALGGRAQEGAGGSMPPAAVWAAGVVVTLAFVALAVYEGIYRGRAGAVTARIRKEQEETEAAGAAERLKQPDVREAVTKVLAVLAILEQMDYHRRRIEEIRAAWALRLGELEAMRRSVPETVPDGLALLIEDRMDQLVRAQRDFERLLDSAIAEVRRRARKGTASAANGPAYAPPGIDGA